MLDRLFIILTISKIYAKWLLRRPLTYFFISMFMPISILIPLTMMASKYYYPDIIIGTLLFSVIGGGISDIAFNVSFDRASKRISFFIVRQVRPIDYMLGIMIGGASYTIFGALIILVIGNIVIGFSLGPLQIVLLLLLVMGAYAISSCIGFILALYGPRDYRLTSSIADVLLFTLSFLAPVYYPIEFLPDFIRPLSYVAYTTHLAYIGKSIIRAEIISIYNLLFIATLFVALFLFSVRGMRWIEV